MTLDKQQVHIEPADFALAILAGNQQQTNEDNKRYIKRQLTLYLEAILLVQDFNQLEKTQFEMSRETQRTQILEKLIERRYQ
ncbi:hypothetical protein [Weissella soli]|uniref:Uncharacterized protein n=1 Tax=Weissella soli TaxID=155866 RepID=A0A288QBP1_9LACO|nr:hypothetical protein [Weissella soli]AOT56672.1 hypothetical protein WSWS_01041 [Weissella soli]MCT8395332.1 hypothetical protein [Weissella soli]NKY83125.1 hypothetical protein [Weissella soli]QEA34420.1 hypothetical protein FGL88_01070 [Weissella soli]RDL12235.1 hypothetical protein DFP99_0670 [Weissella soli]